MNVQSLLRRGFCCESQVFLFGISHRNKLLYMCISHSLHKLLNKKIEGILKGLFVVFLARFPYNPILYYAHSSLLKENNSANNQLPFGLPALFYKRRCVYFRICIMFLFYIKISDHGKKKRKKYLSAKT